MFAAPALHGPVLQWVNSGEHRWVNLDERQGLDDLGRFESPETLAIRSAEARRLHACLAELAPEFREVLVLREMEGLSYRDISAVVGVPMGTVMSRLSRGREQLANAMGSGERRASS